MPRGTGIMYIIFSRCIGCTLEPSVLRGHIAPTEPVETFMYMLYYTGTYYTHTHETAAHGCTCTHIRSSTRPTQKKKKKKTGYNAFVRNGYARCGRKRKKKKGKKRETHF